MREARAVDCGGDGAQAANMRARDDGAWAFRKLRHITPRQRNHVERKLVLWNEFARELVHHARWDEFELWDVVPLCVVVDYVVVIRDYSCRSIDADEALSFFVDRRFELERVVLLRER